MDIPRYAILSCVPKLLCFYKNVPPAILLRFLREHRSEWADNIDAYSAAAVKIGPCSFLGTRVGNFGAQVVLPLAQPIEHEELLEVIKLEGVGHSPEDAMMPRDIFLLQAVGIIAAIGDSVKHLKVGNPAAIMTFGIYAEFTMVRSKHILPVARPDPEVVPMLTSRLTASIV